MLSKGSAKKIMLFLGDTFLFWFSLYTALLVRRPDLTNIDYFVGHISTFAPLFVFYLLAMFATGLYDVPDFNQKITKIKYISLVSVFYILFGNTLFYLFPGPFTPKTVLVMQAVIIFISLAAWRLGTNKLQRFDSKIKTIILGVSDEINEIKSELDKGVYQLDVVKQLHINTKNIESFSSYTVGCIKNQNIKIVVADINSEELKPLLPSIYNLTKDGIRIIDSKYLYQYLFRKMPLSLVGYFWFFENVSLNTKIYEITKRAIDFVIAIPVVVVWMLIHPWAKMQVVKDGNPEVYSEQKRVGRYGKEIIVKKYRTFAYTDGGFWPGEKSNNFITPVGAFLRKTRIDELPQILNVIKGELSLVGPRTDLSNLAERLEAEIPYYMIRYSVTPGLSGWAQIMMHEQPQGIEDTIERLKYDLYYVKNRSFLFDLIIALRTARTLLAQEGR